MMSAVAAISVRAMTMAIGRVRATGWHARLTGCSERVNVEFRVSVWDSMLGMLSSLGCQVTVGGFRSRADRSTATKATTTLMSKTARRE